MDKLDNLIEVVKKSQLGGGDSKIKMQHNLHKMTARERIQSILEQGSFIEIGALVGNNGAGVITGHGTVHGKLVYIYSQDYTVDGGAVNIANSKKICNLMDMAIKMGAPLIQVFDSVGAKLSEGLDILTSYAGILKRNARLSGIVPQIAIIAGPCLGMAALSATMSDFTIMVHNSTELGISSNKQLTKEEEKYVDSKMYSSASKCSENGSIQIDAANDAEAFIIVRKILEYIPSNNMEAPPMGIEASDLNVLNNNLNEMANNEMVNSYEVMRAISDEDSVIELNNNWEPSIITCLTKINGLTTGIITGIITNAEKQPSNLNIGVSEKISRFVKICDCYNIPILSIVDTDGFSVSLMEEQNGLSTHVSKMIYALIEATVPKVSLIIGKAYGAGYLALASKEVAFDISYAWPSAKISVTQPEALIKILHKDEIIQSENPKLKEQEVILKYIEEVTSPYSAAEKGIIDDIIMPSETKQRIFASLDMLHSKREIRYPKKHGTTLI
ncbi:acyl-CoA carboxylase subunit beta [Clostridium tagluense]|uniref:acyl-CoA carboxylase subunit beta n=1 Tax=Clostridium tagluense TaxID=360422 RepID=UPI001C6E883B|nr:carboxyl transferase domain-containing protein [Clostridium tagluense]MBW9156271.1 propionyl-CoA carboxylase [Clostridium tagluense]WLC65492.1 propionyl-CoA carboxylase [Clostridium tagluense]